MKIAVVNIDPSTPRSDIDIFTRCLNSAYNFASIDALAGFGAP